MIFLYETNEKLIPFKLAIWDLYISPCIFVRLPKFASNEGENLREIAEQVIAINQIKKEKENSRCSIRQGDV